MKDQADKKYELTEEAIIVDGHKLYRIRALKDFADVKVGDLGGFVESEDNLSHEGNCWIYHEACVYGDAQVYDDAKVFGFAKVFDGAKAPASGDIRLRIETTRMNQFFSLFYKIKTEEGGFVSVDWGDGNTEIFTGETEYAPWHVYAKAGEYVVKTTGSKFTEVGGHPPSTFRDAMREILSLKMPTDSVSVSLFHAFRGCDNLTGNIPEWDDCITDASYTYKNCKGLTGDIPAWGVKIVDAKYTYFGCKGLTGCSKELLQDPMPSRITEHVRCISGCADVIRKHFTEHWGGPTIHP